MSDPIALFCTCYARNQDKRDRVLNLLKESLPYYRSAESECTTWSYFTPTTRDGAFAALIPADQAPATVCGFETYTSKAALQRQVDDPVHFQSYHETVKNEGLYAAPEELVAWYWRGGFMARGPGPVVTAEGQSPCVVVAKAKFQDAQVEEGVRRLLDFAQYIEQHEPETISYGIFTRPKAPGEVLVFERYTDSKAFSDHMKSPTMESSMRQMQPIMEWITGHEFDETEGSFVGDMDVSIIAKNKL